MANDAQPARITRDPLLETFGPKPEERVGGPFKPDPLLDTGFFRQERQAPDIVPADPLLITGFEADEAQRNKENAEAEKVPVAAWDWYG